MDNRGDLISLIGKYGRECMVTTESVTDDIARRSAAMKAIEDFCDAAILVEREACAVIADDGPGGYSHEAAHAAASTIAETIRARPAP